MRKIVLDIETQNSFQEIGKNDPTLLNISLLVTYDFASKTYETFMEDDFPRLWKLLEQTDMIIGYNSDSFDIPLLNKYYPGDLTHIKSLDLLSEIKNSLGKRIRLNSVAEGTLGLKKSGSGLDAIRWWRKGEILKIKEYCEMDVKITKEVYEFASENNFLKYKDFDGTHKFPINTDSWETKEEVALTYTLPF